MYSTTGLEASNYVSTYNTAFYFIAGVSLLLLIGLTITMLYFIFRYNKKKNPVATQIEGNTVFEITWTVIPLILGACYVLFWMVRLETYHQTSERCYEYYSCCKDVEFFVPV